MKKTLLASALFAGIGAYAAIPSDVNERAELVQKRNELLNANIGKAYALYLSNHPYVESIDVHTRAYNRGEGKATEQTAIVIDWDEKAMGYDGEEFPVKEIVFNNTIDYGDAIAKAGKLAVIKGEPDAENLAKALALVKDTNQQKILKEIFQNIELEASLLDEGQYEQNIRVKPFDVKDDKDLQFSYEGLEYHLKTSDEGILRLEGKTNLKSGKFELNNATPNRHQAKKVVVHPFEFNGDFSNKGKMEFESTPIQTNIDDSIIKIAKIDGKGENLEFDPALGTYLGEQNITLHDLSYGNAEMPEAVYLKTFKINAENKKSRDLYDQKMQFEILPVNESFSALTGGMSETVGVKSITADFEMKNLSGEALKHLQDLTVSFREAQVSKDDTALKANVDALLAQASEHKAELKKEIVLNAKAGDAKLEAQLEFLKDQKLTFDALQAAVNAPEPAQFIDLLSKTVRFEANITLSKDLVDAIGAGAFLENNPYLPLDGKNYKLNLKNSDRGITLNGEAFPPAAPKS